jgi:hypothetical protein
MGKQQRKCTISRCLCILCSLSLMIAIGATLIWYYAFFTQDDPEPVASCGGCHCITGNGTCPTTRVPRTNFSDEEIDTWSSFDIMNPYRLGCNPYGNADDCQTIPAQDDNLLSNGNEAVCAIHFVDEFEENGDNNSTSSICHGASYRLKTYSSFQDATAVGGSVTHMGHCGVCSSLQDFAAYVKHPDLTSQGKFCAEQGASFSFEIGRDCYRSLGLSDSCAAIWAHSSWNTAKECFLQCLLENEQQHKDKSNNGPAPECKLNDCLQCDEDASGALFERIAGRTQRRSGLLSSIARPCDQLVLDIEHEACPNTLP